MKNRSVIALVMLCVLCDVCAAQTRPVREQQQQPMAPLNGAELTSAILRQFPDGFEILEKLSPEQRAACEATPVTIHLKNVTPLRVIHEAARQANVTVYELPQDLGQEHIRPMNVDLEKQPLWWALAQASVAGDIHVHSRAEGALSLGVGTPVLLRTHPWTVSGPMLLYVSPITQRNEFGRANIELCDLTVWAAAEPKMAILGGCGATVLEVVDQDGQNLPHEPNRSILTSGPAGNWIAFRCTFRPRPGRNRQLSYIKCVGRCLVEVQSDRHRFLIDWNSKDVSATVAGIKFTVTEVSSRPSENYSNGLYRIVLSMPPVEDRQERQRRLRLLEATRVEVLDRQRKPIAITSQFAEIDGIRPVMSIEGPRIFRNGSENADPQLLQINVPTKAVVLDVPFEFRKLAVPDAEKKPK